MRNIITSNFLLINKSIPDRRDIRGGDPCVYFSRFTRCMTHHFLNDPQVHALLDHMAAKGMAEPVGIHPALYAGSPAGVFENLFDGTLRVLASAFLRNKNEIITTFSLGMLPHRLMYNFRERNDPVFLSLAAFNVDQPAIISEVS